jgi:multidrug resistance efflux pump
LLARSTMTTAPIFSVVSDDRIRAESAAWAQFSAPKDRAEFCASWLAILCNQIERVNGALLLLGPDADGGFGAEAVWPDAQRSMQYLAPTAQRALKERRGVVAGPSGERPPERDEPAHVGYPVEVGGALRGAVVLDLAKGSERDLQHALRLVHWASVWLVDQFRQQALAEQSARLERLALANDIVATAVQGHRLGAAALAVANELAARLQCDRVSIGFERSGSIEVEAISHTATFDAKTSLVRALADAMDEVLDLDLAVVHPPLDGQEVGNAAHAELLALNRDVSVCSVPLVDGGHTFGVMTLERATLESADGHSQRPFDEATLALCTTVGQLLGPIFRLQRDDERGLWRRTGDAVSGGARALFGPGHPGLKLITLTSAVVLAVLTLVHLPYRVTSHAVVEGAVQRAAVAPFEGYIAASYVRAGDKVKRGQVLCSLVDQDLKLDQMRWRAERDLAQQKLRQASAAQDRAAMVMAMAQSDQAQAQLSLVDEKIARASIVAPFDGLVVTGDLSQSLGSPVEQGKVLFEIAPLDAYRVILNVDERDIGDLVEGQAGELALAGLPRGVLPFKVKTITPISTAQDGRNYFRIEAQLSDAGTSLRPGMEGIGKVKVGERRLIWIWTHSLVDWLRLTLWKWAP